MTATRDPDRLIRAWLDLMPDEAPDRAITSVLLAVEATPQRRSRSVDGPWRASPMIRFAFVAAAAAIVVAVGALLLPRGPSVGQPLPTSSVPPSVGAAVPGALQHSWLGAPRDVPGIAGNSRASLEFLGTTVTLGTATTTVIAGTVQATDTTITLTDSVTVGCAANDVGRFTWTLSPSGSRLHVTTVDDPCAARATALAGDWFRVACKAQNSCFGDVDAGTYPTVNFGPRLDPAEAPRSVFGAVTYSLPDGWAVASDHTSDLRLVRSADYALETPDGPGSNGMNGLEAWIRPAANRQDCSESADAGVPTTASGLISWVAGLGSLVATPPKPITIDGHAGLWTDIRVAPTWTTTCGFSSPSVLLFHEFVGAGGSVGTDPWVVGISGQTRYRLIALDLGGGRTTLFIVHADDPDQFDGLVRDGMPILESFRFH